MDRRSGGCRADKSTTCAHEAAAITCLPGSVVPFNAALLCAGKGLCWCLVLASHRECGGNTNRDTQQMWRVPTHGFGRHRAQGTKKPGKPGLSVRHLNCFGLSETGIWCPEEDSNLHSLRNTDLNRARLPIPPSGLVRAHVSGQTMCVNALFKLLLACRLSCPALPSRPRSNRRSACR